MQLRKNSKTIKVMFSSSLSDSPTPTELTIPTVSFLSLEGLYKDKYVFMYISKHFFIFIQMIPLYAMLVPFLFHLTLSWK